jgi:hypothetical protein
MPIIHVLLGSIDKEQLELILDYYNSNKDILDEPLEILDRCEGGFKIQLAYMKNQFGDPNNMCKQVRWKNGQLISNGYISFTYNETMLLYQSLCHVLGNNNVSLL